MITKWCGLHLCQTIQFFTASSRSIICYIIKGRVASCAVQIYSVNLSNYEFQFFDREQWRPHLKHWTILQRQHWSQWGLQDLLNAAEKTDQRVQQLCDLSIIPLPVSVMCDCLSYVGHIRGRWLLRFSERDEGKVVVLIRRTSSKKRQLL